MNNTIFNSVFEMELRIVFVLATDRMRSFSKDKINALDFISLYGTQFDISRKNINGDNDYKFAEIGSRRELIQEALKELITRGLALPALENGFSYKISDEGLKFVEGFESEYAREYRSVSQRANEKYGDMTEDDLMRLIEDVAIRGMSGGK